MDIRVYWKKNRKRHDTEMIFKMYDIGPPFRLFSYSFYLSFICITIFCRSLMKPDQIYVQRSSYTIPSVWKSKNVLYFL